ncbi:hypothetical protein PAXRUDRAFT_820974 [Paxillus rubicundulus Ve08.2h10]|uniref:Uncharacterized protein n=1 Tax=Paxillus rubicundulus Ve08.2h10 TaxID=930991 RepID=A0A0D0EDE3_9AGAM|nr:hypothetical protein PAXRUDRAFT_820974 [Paxillus rubicundulus Ve08.2h10]
MSTPDLGQRELLASNQQAIAVIVAMPALSQANGALLPVHFVVAITYRVSYPTTCSMPQVTSSMRASLNWQSGTETVYPTSGGEECSRRWLAAYQPTSPRNTLEGVS